MAAKAKAKSYKEICLQYVDDVLHGRKKVGKEIVLACARFQHDMKREDLELHTKEPDLVIGIIEKTMVHMQGEDLEGRPLMNTPLLLQSWQVFIVYNLVGWYYKGTKERRYKEAFILYPEKMERPRSSQVWPGVWLSWRDVPELPCISWQRLRSRLVSPSNLSFIRFARAA